ncbi:MAG: kinase/pyrophosphorylase [Betaproteobacteria bacterium]|nr:kinase/pyrophosphorylase [Betaproteobacteria bacterium]MDE2624004.1 kinase/pyrophosphorylase [Betaproteobacteria bacterium]
MKRNVFYVSDRTGITAEMLGQSLTTQFDGMQFERHTLPFVDSLERARDAVAAINRKAHEDGGRPIVFCTLVDDAIRDEVRKAEALVLDFFEVFIAPLEVELRKASSHAIGKSHGTGDLSRYTERINAINFSMAHDDGLGANGFGEAELILVGVSRSGKTPTSLYLALQFGIKAANYPLVPEDLEKQRLPDVLLPWRSKLWGLSIRPERLHQIRSERRPDSRYASLANCRHEIQAAEALMRMQGIPFLDSTNTSIEELSTTILHETTLSRHRF